MDISNQSPTQLTACSSLHNYMSIPNQSSTQLTACSSLHIWTYQTSHPLSSLHAPLYIYGHTKPVIHTADCMLLFTYMDIPNQSSTQLTACSSLHIWTYQTSHPLSSLHAPLYIYGHNKPVIHSAHCMLLFTYMDIPNQSSTQLTACSSLHIWTYQTSHPLSSLHAPLYIYGHTKPVIHSAHCMLLFTYMDIPNQSSTQLTACSSLHIWTYQTSHPLSSLHAPLYIYGHTKPVIHSAHCMLLFTYMDIPNQSSTQLTACSSLHIWTYQTSHPLS